MTSQQISGLVLFLLLIVQCESKTEIGDYIVDCSACNSVPVRGISSYSSCKVRCDVQGKFFFDFFTEDDLSIFKEKGTSEMCLSVVRIFRLKFNLQLEPSDAVLRKTMFSVVSVYQSIHRGSSCVHYP